MATKNGIKRPPMTAQKARDVLREILDARKEIHEISLTQHNAIVLAVGFLDRANAEGADMHRAAAILRYHANEPKAELFCDEYTRGALEAAVNCINKYIAARGGGEND